MKSWSVFLLLLPFFSISQNKKVFIAMDDLNPNTIAKVKKQGFDEIKVVYGDFIYPQNSHTVDEKILKAEIKRLFPNENDSGYGMLDWEGPVFNTITGLEKTNLVLKDCINEFVKAIEIAKKMRPNVCWGYFDLPLRKEFFSNDKVWKLQMKNIHKILNKSDVIYTAFYKQSPDYTFSNSNLDEILNLSIEYKLQVFPVVWNRYDTANNKYRHQLLKEKDFQKMITSILNYKKNGKKVNGIIWWGRDSWFYKAYKSTIKEAKTFDEYDKNYNERVIRILNNFQ